MGSNCSRMQPRQHSRLCGVLQQHALSPQHDLLNLCPTVLLCCRPTLQVQLFRYDGEEWLNVISRDPALASMGWTKDETDYLLDMLEQYDLRFVVVADRYNVSTAAASQQRRGRQGGCCSYST